MRVKDLLELMDTGACHLLFIIDDTGEVSFQTIWHDTVPYDYLNKKIRKLEVRDYLIRIHI